LEDCSTFPASATLVESHEKEKKNRARLDPGIRPQNADALDAAGSTMGAIGSFVFALLTWRLLPNYKTWAVLLVSNRLADSIRGRLGNLGGGVTAEQYWRKSSVIFIVPDPPAKPELLAHAKRI
jgi:hypothetical protein